MKKKSERDKKGRYVKGHKGGPGRKKGDPRDLICKDGKKRSVGVLLDDLLKAYASMGGEKFIKKWALESRGNLKKFIEILFKFAPQPGVSSMAGGGPTHELSDKFLPKFKIERIITDINPDEYERLLKEIPESADARKKVIMKLQAELKKRDEHESMKMRMPRPGDPVKQEELEHEPISPLELPEHSEIEIEEKIEVLKKRKAELEHELEEKGK